MVTDLLDETKTRLKELNPKTPDDIRASNTPIAGFSESMRANDAALKKFLFEKYLNFSILLFRTVDFDIKKRKTRNVKNKIIENNSYPKKNCTTKLEESIDLNLQINNKQKKGEINLRTVVNMPSGTGKKVKE